MERMASELQQGLPSDAVEDCTNGDATERRDN